MKKTIGTILSGMICVLLLIFTVPVQAENSDKVVDNADLLTDSEEEKLEELFTKISEQYQSDVVVLTTDTLNGTTPRNYTEEFYEANDYGYGSDYSGIILMISMEDRDYWMATYGTAIDTFTDHGQRQIQQMFLEDLSDGAYYRAFRTFGEAAEDFMQQAEEGQPYDIDNEYRIPMATGTRLLIAFGVSLAAAVIVLLVLFSQLKSVRSKNQARAYVRNGSFHVTRVNDLYLYHTMTRRKIEAPNQSRGGGGGSSIHTTSGGRSAGGSGGKF